MSTDTFLSQEEVDALLRGVHGIDDELEVVEDTGGVRPYNLATQERIVRGRMPTLEIMNERFARLLRIGMFNFLRRNTEVSVGPVRVSRYSEFLKNLVVPTHLNMVHIKPLRGTGMIVIEPVLAFLVIDNLFGSDGRFPFRVEGREFTQTEQRVIQRMLEIIFATYSESWEPIYPIEFEYIRSEMNTQFANIATPSEVVVSSAFRLDIGDSGGSIHICTPYTMIEPVRDILTSSMQGETLEVDKRWLRLLRQQLQTAEVELVAEFGTAKTNIEGLLQMKVGDIIPLTVPERIEGKVDGVPIMECSYGRSHGQYALRIERLVSISADGAIQGDDYV